MRVSSTYRLWCVFVFALLLPLVFSVIQPNSAQATAGILKQINFQGKVVNKTTGTNIANNTYSFTFSIYNVDTAGTAIWTETKNVVVTNGIFQTLLGSTTALPGSLDFNTQELYLGINFNSDGEMLPRVRFAAVPYAFNALKVAGLTVTDTTGTLTIPNTSTIAFSGANNVTFTSTGSTGVTLPTTGTLATLAGSEEFTNKTIGSTGLVFSGATNDITTVSGQHLAIMPDTTGNVGIGTTTPSAKLGVAGSATISATLSLGPLPTVDAGTCDATAKGKQYFDGVTNKMYYCSGSSWTDMTGGGGGGALDTLTAATTTDTALLNADNSIIWEWAMTNAGRRGVTIGESAASTGGIGNQFLFEVTTDAGSTAGPLSIISNSADAGDIEFDLNSAGDFLIMDAGTAFATFDDTGFFQLDNVKLDANTLSTTTGDLTIDATGGNILLADALNAGGATEAAYNFFADALTGKGNANVATDNDLYIEGALEVDGQIQFDTLSTTGVVLSTTGVLSSVATVGSTYITDNDLTATDLSATLTFLAGDILDLSASTDQGKGLVLPQGIATNPTNPAAGEGHAYWETDTDTLRVYNGATWTSFGASTSYTFSNGLTEAAGAVKLGGTLTAATDVPLGGFNFTFSGTGNVGIGTTTTPEKLTVSGSATISGTLALGPMPTVDAGTCNASAKGKQYMDGVANKMYYCNGTSWTDMTGGGGYTVSNGLTESGGALKLGGALTADTTITQDTAEVLTFANAGSGNTIFNLSSTGDFVVNDGVSDLLKLNDDGTIDVISAIATVDAIDIALNSITTANGIDLTLDGLTSGAGLKISSTATALTTGSLIDLLWNPATSERYSTGDLFKIDLGQFANPLNLFALYDNAVKLFSVSQTNVTSALPHEFTAAGDVSIANDLVFTNQTASLIDSYGPLTLSSGESFENNNLTLRAYGTGRVVLTASGLSLETGETLVLDSNDSSDSYITHDNTNNRLGIWVDNSEEVRIFAAGTNSIEANRVITTGNNFDIAETYPTFDETLAPGDLVMIDTTNTSAIPAVVKKADAKNASAVIGIVSTAPGFTMGSGTFAGETCSEVIDKGFDQYMVDQRTQLDLELAEASASASTATASAYTIIQSTTDEKLIAIESATRGCLAAKQVLVALAGRVPVKVSTENGPIAAGDYLTQSATTGIAMKATSPGIVVGKALEAFTSTEADGKIMAFVNLTYYPGYSLFGSVAATASVSLSNTSLPSDLFQQVAGALVIAGDVSVTKTLFASDVYAASSLSTGVVQIDGLDGSISTTTGDLRLQTGDVLGNVDIFNGLLVFTPDGGIITQSDIMANRVKAKELVILGASDNEANSSIGSGKILTGATTSTIANTKVKIGSKIFITPTSGTGGQSLIVENKIDGSFTVSLDHAHSAAISFDYWIVGVE